MYLYVMNDVLFERLFFWSFIGGLVQRQGSELPAAIMVTLQYGVRPPINCFFVDELIWGIPSTSIGRWNCYYKLYSNIENADILLTQCPEKRRKQA